MPLLRLWCGSVLPRGEFGSCTCASRVGVGAMLKCLSYLAGYPFPGGNYFGLLRISVGVGTRVECLPLPLGVALRQR